MISIDLSGKTAVITGSARGIGRAIAEKLAEAGANIIISDIMAEVGEVTAKEIADKYSVKTAFVEANVTKEETYNLANIIMDEMTKGTGAQNKGLLAREKTVVIRDTAMPSVLIELGFLTNIQEAQLLTDETYQDLLVESIIKGIERYFEIY